MNCYINYGHALTYSILPSCFISYSLSYLCLMLLPTCAPPRGLPPVAQNCLPNNLEVPWARRPVYSFPSIERLREARTQSLRYLYIIFYNITIIQYYIKYSIRPRPSGVYACRPRLPTLPTLRRGGCLGADTTCGVFPLGHHPGRCPLADIVSGVGGRAMPATECIPLL